MAPDFLRKLPIIVTCGLILWVGAKFLLPIALPFLLAALLAAAAEPLVSALQRRVKLPRSAATGLGITMALVMLILLVMVLGALLVRQLQNLVGIVPDLESTALSGMDSLQLWLLSLASSAPDSIEPMLTHSLQNFFSDGTALLDKLAAWLLSLASGLVSRLPDSALGLGTWLVASFMFSAKLPKIKQWLRAKVPDSWHQKYLPLLQKLKRSVLGWLSAQMKLISITFLVLSLGFLLLRIDHAVIWAFLISLVDALPILGTGTVLIPWSLVCFIQGDAVGGIGLLGVYATAVLLRSVLEPKLIGKQLGLDSLLTLAAMYTGYCLWGIMGLLFAPLIAVTAVQIFSQQKEI